VRLASPYTARVGMIAVCGLLALATLSGCTTTQETAARVQAKSKQILDAHGQRVKQRAKALKKENK
jgi:outer membrane lipoprotein-sorting protein